MKPVHAEEAGSTTSEAKTVPESQESQRIKERVLVMLEMKAISKVEVLCVCVERTPWFTCNSLEFGFGMGSKI